jgi:hypothetical protein
MIDASVLESKYGGDDVVPFDSAVYIKTFYKEKANEKAETLQEASKVSDEVKTVFDAAVAE